MNDQRMVPVELLQQLLRLAGNTPDYEEYQGPADKLRAIISGPGVEPVIRLHVAETDEWPDVRVEVLNGERLQPQDSPIPLYLAAPSAPVQAVQEVVEKLEACDKTLRELQGKYSSQAVPDDWQLVSKEPTPAMCGAVTCFANVPSQVYRAMLAAAPQPPATTDKENGE